MKVQTPPGMRDFYPEDMRLQNWLFAHWRAAAECAGFVEFEGPIFEFLDLYRVKSGDEIVEQLFHFTDRGEREFAIRPEMTPTLARMVAARANALPRPIKWFSLPRMCRAEKPQRGRLREFFQWNVDLIGIDDPLADAEVVSVAAGFFDRVGLRPADVVLRVSSRTLAQSVLEAAGVAAEAMPRAFALLDRLEKLPTEEFDRQWNAALGAELPAAELRARIEDRRVESWLAAARRGGAAGEAAANNFSVFWERLGQLGVAEYCEFDPRIVRGLAYYTGIVFEAYCRDVDLRALLGGGRYDNLTALFGGPPLPGVGFGMGDAPMIEALRAIGRLPEWTGALDVFVIDAAEAQFPAVLEWTARLRKAGIAADYSYKRQALPKQLKQAHSRGARIALLIGEAYATGGRLILRDMATGSQREESADTCREDSSRLHDLFVLPGDTASGSK